MRKLSNAIYSGELPNPSNIEVFPNTSLRTSWRDGSSPCLAFYLDSTLGDDANDGLSWETALKTLAGLASIIPYNLQNVEVFIFFQPGTYDNPYKVNFTHINGIINFCSPGLFMNTEDTPYALFVRNGKTSPIRTDLPAYLNFDDCLELFSIAKSCSYFFHNQNLALAITDANACYNGKIQLSTHNYNRTVSLIKIKDCIFNSLSTINFYMANLLTGSHAIESLGNCTLNLNSFYIQSTYGAGQSGLAVGSNNGAILCDNNDIVNFTSVALSYNNAYGPPIHKNWLIYWTSQLLCNKPNATVTYLINLATNSVHFERGTLSPAYPAIRMEQFTAGYISASTFEVIIDNLSVLPIIITNLADSSISKYLSPNIIDKTNNVNLKTKNAIPADTVLANEFMTFYLDETTNKLKVKLKYSTGVVKSGEIALL